MRADLPCYRWGVNQVVATSGTSAATAAAVGSQTREVRLYATEAMHIAYGKTPTATTSHPILGAGGAEYIRINPGESVAALQVSAGGSLHVTELTQ